MEAALLGEEGNEELLKLKQDLEEVIALQEELVAPPKPTSNPEAPANDDPEQPGG